MGQDVTNTRARDHWNPRAGGGWELVDFKLYLHHGGESVTADFPKVTGATLWNGLRTQAALGLSDLESYIANSTDVPSAWKTEWDNEVDASTEVKTDACDWFANVAPPG